MSVGVLVLHKTTDDRELSVLAELDFSKRHEVALGGQTITGVPTLRVLLDDVVSTDLTISSMALDATSKKVQFRVTVAAAAAPGIYHITCAVVLSGGATLVEALSVRVDDPA